MPARKRRAGDLTGGTGDIKPQQITASTNPSGVIVDQYQISTINLPIPRFADTEERTGVWEIIKVWLYLGVLDPDPNVNHIGYLTTLPGRVGGTASDLSSFAEDLTDPLTFAAGLIEASAATTNRVSEWPIEIDMTDGAGNGFLVATDQLFFVYGSFSATLISSFGTVKILYRLSGVGLREYIGIVQSQVS